LLAKRRKFRQQQQHSANSDNSNNSLDANSNSNDNSRQSSPQNLSKNNRLHVNEKKMFTSFVYNFLFIG